MIYFIPLVLVVVFMWVTWRFPQKMTRLALWVLLFWLLLVTHILFNDVHAIVRMVVLCVVMMGMMKCVVYAEWVRQTGKRLSAARWWMFAVLWFGMEPGMWVRRRVGLGWKKDFWIGVMCVLVGWGACRVLLLLDIDYILPVFVALSVAFHFGVLRVFTAFWRWCGFPVRVLFRNPLPARGFGNFWSGRWNLAYSQMMARGVQKPLLRRWNAKVVGVFVFLLSGIFHEVAISLPVRSGFGGPLLYFAIHGVLAMVDLGKWTVWGRRFVLWVALVLPLPLLFPPAFQEQVIVPVLEVFGRIFEI